uniref:RecF/RecN/SMC N-terminal domain-containing protein n=1 Tax=Kalanchoe fedtschenkoi TaxID=63787 RepID=A0A7N0REW4_KALFE
MSESRVRAENGALPPRPMAGIITRIKVENFMCHSSMQIELGDSVNFITGQNGSGKSAILTALCIAFGSRAKSTERAATLKDFIKTGCSSASVSVDIKNQGVDAFKPEAYGDLITIERRISGSSSITVMKDHLGRKVADKKADLYELIEHCNIDVQNPCVIMTQDKSREFLHSGSAKEKFKFFFKATLLQHLDEMLNSIGKNLMTADTFVTELEKSISPKLKELDEIQNKIKNMEHVEEITQQLQLLKKKLAWSWVYDVDRQLQEQMDRLKKLRDRIPACEAKIEAQKMIVEQLMEQFTEKKTEVASMIEETSKVRKLKEELKQSLSLATNERVQLEEAHKRKTNHLQKLLMRIKSYEQQAQDIQEQHVKNTQAEESEMEARMKEIQDDLDKSNSTLSRLKADEQELSMLLSSVIDEIREINDQIESCGRRQNELQSSIRELRRNQTNKVTAFGGDRVMQLLRAIERRHREFKEPPIGPIGVHLKLVNGERWAPAVENAIGKLFNSLIVTNHKDSMLLRSCARDAHYQHLHIIIYDFSRPRLNIPDHMVPQTRHPTTLSVVQADTPAVYNVLVDMGNAERQVLVKDYEEGKTVAFDQRIQNLKEVYTMDGYKMFSRASVQTILPPNKKARTGRLCGSYDDQIVDLEQEQQNLLEQLNGRRDRKRRMAEEQEDLKDKLNQIKRRRLAVEREAASNEIAMKDLEKSFAAESSQAPTATVDELHQEISNMMAEFQKGEQSLGDIEVRMIDAEEKVKDLNASFESFHESARGKVDALEEEEQKLKSIQEDLQKAESSKIHYETVMSEKVLPDIKEAEKQLQDLELERRENSQKASIICPESEIEALGGVDESQVQLDAKIKRFKQRLEHESQRHSESIEDLRMLYSKKERKITRKQQTYAAFREKLNVCQKALELRRRKFDRNASLLKKQLTWQFNKHLGKKGISGAVIVDYDEKTLSLEVKMPQDASSSTVRDTRGLSGGERSFSTLCFALALHEMTEAPFRAMDEFDVFMDAVSRKISLDTLVEFALGQDSQWIFITPHDISMVKHDDRIKKQQMAAPRS